MKTVTVTAYEFDELSDSAKENAREWFRSGSCDENFWSECMLEEAAREGELMGIDFALRERKNMKGEPLPGAPKIYWSGFWSQGDGACFEGTWRASDVKADKVADGWGEDPATTEIKRIAAEFERIAKAYPDSSFTVKHSGSYSHENCTVFDFHDDNDGEDWPEEKREAWGEECENLKENAKDFMRWIYRQLEKEYEYQNSNEAVDYQMKNNDHLFTTEGSRSIEL